MEGILILTSGILILFMIILILYWIRSAPNSVTNTLQCGPGECLTNIYNGIKTCPEPGQTISGDPAINVCNPASGCALGRTPFAVQPDGSTSVSGQCAGDICRCVSKPQCANYITSYFTYVNGNPFLGATETIPGVNDPFSGQRVLFPAITSYTNVLGQVISEPPLTYDNPSTGFCAIPSSWLGRVQGGGCPRGVLAYLPENPGTFNAGELDITPVGCVQGSPCPTGIAYWNGTGVACLNS